MPDGDVFTKRTFVCKGERRGATSGKMLVVFAELLPDGGLGESRLYQPKGILAHSGGVYEIEASDNSIHIRTVRFLRTYEDESARKEWQALTQLDRAEIKSERLEKKDGLRDELAEALLPWRKIYQNTIGRDRTTALELMVLRALRKRVPPK
jgi:hypothetical protein